MTSPVGGALDARQTTQLLLHGHVDQAFENLHRRAHQRDAPVTIDFPVHTAGVAQDELLLVDRSQALIFGADGRLLYHGPNAGASEGLLTADSGDARIRADLIIRPSKCRATSTGRTAATAVRLEMDYTLTLVKVGRRA